MDHVAKRAFDYFVGRRNESRREWRAVQNACKCSGSSQQEAEFAAAIAGAPDGVCVYEGDRLAVVPGSRETETSFKGRMDVLMRNQEEKAGDRESPARAAEGELIEKILSGQRDLFLELIRPYERTVYATALSLVGNKDDVEDVVQTAMLKGLSKLSQFRREAAFGTWLVQITINEVRMRKRKERRVEMVSLTPKQDENGERDYAPRDFEDWREIPSEALERAEVRDVLMKALSSLELDYREAFVLRDVHELSITDTAQILGISRGAVKTRLHRARLRLRDILSPGYGQDGRLGWSLREARNPWE
jgi:RNA polymerase sigma-70 factor, ECF subfamily